MIGKVMRGQKVYGLLRYLFGPGRANAHLDAHLVASWDDQPASLEPRPTVTGRLDYRPLTGLLEQPLALNPRPVTMPVWHCALRTAPSDRRLTDQEWAGVARDVVRRVGFETPDGGGCRWVAVRHADDHVHLVVTLGRQDGRRVSTSNDFYRVGEACQAAEESLGLVRTAPRDRTATKRPTRGETEKAARLGRAEPARSRLRREVRFAAVAASDPTDFLQRLTAAGLLVRERHGERDHEQITGYAIALPGDRNATREPVWFGGGKLAPDLSLPS